MTKCRLEHKRNKGKRKGERGESDKERVNVREVHSMSVKEKIRRRRLKDKTDKQRGISRET